MSKIFNLENYFYINNNSLSRELCNEIISTFESENFGKYDGMTAGGLNKNIKDTVDFLIPDKNQNDKSQWSKIRTVLDKELNNNVKKYIKKINDCISVNEENSSNKYLVFNKFVTFETIQIQRYTKNKGRYIYHNDFACDLKNKKYRVITFLWYLNDVSEGGETEFWATHKIKPETGKLLLFPATWTYPHRGMMPVSNDKYIMTGWIYLHE
jgi:hypothetical protein